MTQALTPITIAASINAPISKVWDYFTLPEHIVNWNQASPDWHTPWAKNDLQAGGRFSSRMEARDGSMGFEFGGVYDAVTPLEGFAYTMEDGRKVQVVFAEDNGQTTIQETFDPEATNPIEMQRAGWQAILDSFKQYTESH